MEDKLRRNRRRMQNLIMLVLLISLLVSLLILLYGQTRQVNIRALSPDIEWVQFENGLGERVSRRSGSCVRTYFNGKKGRKYAKVHLRDGREFQIHYFHKDIGLRRRVLIEFDVDSKTDTAVVRLLFADQEVAKGNYQIAEIKGKMIDLAILERQYQTPESDDLKAIYQE